MRSFLLFLFVMGPAAGQNLRYIGAGGCASSNCHGGTTAASEKDSRIFGNEYSIWSVRDKHSKAYSVLADARSRRMTEILKLGNPQKAQRCLACHAVGSPEKSVSDGVACEACHGPAEKWLGPHTAANNPHANNVALGMYDTKNLELRAKKCLECHLGTSEKFVDHELIAAGHPDLVFELDTFSAGQPAHNREPQPAAGNSLPHARAWAVGQAVALAEQMRALAAHASAAASWPAFSDLECYQCHHDLRKDSLRIARGYAGRKPGSLLVNVSHIDMVRILAAEAAREHAGALDSSLAQVTSLVQDKLADGAAIAQAARAAEQQARALAAAMAQKDFDAALARAVVRALDGGIVRVADDGVQAAEQAAMSLDALGNAYAGSQPAAQAAIGKLYDYLEHPSVYDPSEFATQFRRAAGTLR
ncbi:MAG TPA: multiheme c-type cytochrome [Bryobacterales bacterium]|nr:multiheme c-type cytochrome [Bryobacterales bacterium]